MPQKLAKHGSEAGYKAHLTTGDVCERCRNGHRVYARQFRPRGKSAGLHYGTYDVIDHLYSQSQSVPGQNRGRAEQTRTRPRTAERAAEPASSQDTEQGPTEPEPGAHGSDGPTLRDRVAEGLSKLRVKGGNDYVESGEPEDYLSPIDPDPEPDGEWSKVTDDEFVINRAGMVLIEENLGTYLSVLGITMEMVDPYCGPILADNFDNIVGRWTKVIARYPRAAKLFMSKDGGTLMTWVGAIQATWPVLLAVYEHHLARTVQTDKQGRVFNVRQSANGNQPNVDATMPPMPGYDYTVD